MRFLILVAIAAIIAIMIRPHYHCTLIDGGKLGAIIEMRVFPLFGDSNCEGGMDSATNGERG